MITFGFSASARAMQNALALAAGKLVRITPHRFRWQADLLQ
jgi:hypothetical protein